MSTTVISPRAKKYLQLLRSIEKLGGAEAYAKSLTGAHALVSNLPKRDPVATVSIEVFCSAVTIDITTSDGHHGYGGGLGVMVQDVKFQGTMTLLAPWDVIVSGENDFSLSIKEEGAGAKILFKVKEQEVATIRSAKLSYPIAADVEGSFCWSSEADAVPANVGHEIDLLRGLEKFGGAAAYDKFLSSTTEPCPHKPLRTLDPINSVAARVTFQSFGSYIQMHIDTNDKHCGVGSAWGLEIPVIEAPGLLKVYVTPWERLMSATNSFCIKAYEDTAVVHFFIEDEHVADLECSRNELAPVVGLSSKQHIWSPCTMFKNVGANGADRAGANGAASTASA